jgi:hypothetical protein
MNFVDEQHFTRLEVRQDAREIPGLLDHRPGRGANRHAKLVGNHVRQRGLAQPRRPIEQRVIERFAALARGGHRHFKLFANAILADVIVQAARPEALVLRVLVHAGRR